MKVEVEVEKEVEKGEAKYHHPSTPLPVCSA